MCYNKIELIARKDGITYMTTGQIIKMLREERGMTQETLAELMGYSHKSSINKIELGKADLPQSKLIAFAKVLNVSPCELLGLGPTKTPTAEQIQLWDKQYNGKNQLQTEVQIIEAVQKQFGKDAVALLHLFNTLNKSGKKKAIENLEDLSAIERYTKNETIHIIKKAARNGSFEEKVITNDELDEIKNLPNVDDLK